MGVNLFFLLGFSFLWLLHVFSTLKKCSADFFYIDSIFLMFGTKYFATGLKPLAEYPGGMCWWWNDRAFVIILTFSHTSNVSLQNSTSRGKFFACLFFLLTLTTVGDLGNYCFDYFWLFKTSAVSTQLKNWSASPPANEPTLKWVCQWTEAQIKWNAIDPHVCS